MKAPITEVMYLIVLRFVREHGTPLPKRLLEIGDKDNGWHVALNLTKEQIEKVKPFQALVLFDGIPGALIDPGGSCAFGFLDVDSLCEWLEADLAVTHNVKLEVSDG